MSHPPRRRAAAARRRQEVEVIVFPRRRSVELMRAELAPQEQNSESPPKSEGGEKS